VLRIAVAVVMVAGALTIAMQPSMSGSPLALVVLGIREFRLHFSERRDVSGR